MPVILFEEKDKHKVVALLEKLDSEDLKETWSVDAIHGALPLHFACTSGNIELVQCLISQYLGVHYNVR